MTDGDIETVFALMGSKLSSYGDNRSVCCPLAPWNHSKGRDKQPSVTVKQGAFCVVFRCWSCGSSGSLRKLAQLYGCYSGDCRALLYIQEREGKRIEPSAHKYGDAKRRLGWKLKQEEKYVVTEEKVKGFGDEIPRYAFTRGMTEAQVLRWEIGYDGYQKRMTIPIRDYKKKLVGVSGRDLTNTGLRYRHYPGFKKETVFYGEHRRDQQSRTIYIVEGFFDVYGLERLGVTNAFASMGTSLSFDQMKKIRDWCDIVYFCIDGDQPGLRFAEKFAMDVFIQLNKEVGILGVRLNRGFKKLEATINKWTPEDYRFEILDRFKNRDPSDWTSDDLDDAMSNVGFFSIGEGGIRAEIRSNI